MKQLSAPELKSMLDRREVILFDVRPDAALLIYKGDSMSSHPTEFQGSVIDALREAIERQIPDSRAEVNGGGGHFNIEVTSPVFAGKNMLQSQRLVYGAIADLMKGDKAPVHAVDSLKSRTPTAGRA